MFRIKPGCNRAMLAIYLFIALIGISFSSAVTASGFVEIKSILVERVDKKQLENVSLIEAGQSVKRRISTGDKLVEGLEIIIPARTVITLKSSNGNMITLQPGSRFKVLHVDVDGEVHGIEAGKAEFSVANALSFFNVNYRSYSAMVRGTRYAVSVDPERAFQVEVAEGKVLAQQEMRVLIRDGAVDRSASIPGLDILTRGKSVQYQLDKEQYFKKFGNFAEAEQYYRAKLLDDEASGDADRLVNGLNALGIILHQIGKFPEAMQIFERALEILHGMPKPPLAWQASLKHNLGAVEYQLGEYRDSIASIQQALLIDEILHNNKTSYALSYDALGLAYQAIGDLNKAQKYQLHAITLWSASLSDATRSDFAKSLDNLGVTYFKLSDYTKAIEYHEKALVIRKQCYPDGNHPDLATSYNNLGSAYHALGSYSSAIEYFEKSLAIRQRAYPDGNHPDIATTLNSLGESINLTGEHDRAIQLYKKALDIRLRVYPSGSHPDIAASYFSLGSATYDLGEYRSAMGFYQKAWAMREKTLSIDHPDTIEAKRNVALCLRELHEFELALPMLQEVLAAQMLATSHVAALRTQGSIAKLHYMAGNSALAIELLQHAIKQADVELGTGHAISIGLANELKQFTASSLPVKP